MSGSFAELRKNHFHTGIDLRVGGKVGIPIYAVESGYVSRIKVSAGGYGNVVYINHFNGYKTVYAHLSRFNKKIANFIRQRQYETETFEQDIILDSMQIPVAKGEIIGYSGNSGYSFGPHLHFEVRDWNDVAYNPQLFGFKITDNIPPRIKTIVIYPATDTSIVNFKHEPLIKKVQVIHGKYHLQPPIVVYGAIYFGIEAYDYLNGVNSRNAVYSVKLYVDDTLILAYRFEKISFDENRAINSFTDYKLRNTTSFRIQRSIVEPGNRLPIYDSVRNNGTVVFHDNQYHIVKYVVSDIYGNKRSISFQVKNSTRAKKLKLFKNDTNYTVKFKYDKANSYRTRDLEIFTDEYSLYRDTGIIIRKSKPIQGAVSPVYTVGDYFIPLHKPMIVSIATYNVPCRLVDKTYIVKENFKGEKEALKSVYKDGFVSAFSKEFGKFYLMIDTIAPKISPVKNYKGKNLSSYGKIMFKITDEQSGIQNFTGFINGNWALFEYDKKYDLLIYKFDKSVKKGKNELILFVKDNCGNIAEYKMFFYR